MKKKMLIVGAGLAGLTAGCYLQKKGHEVQILERNAFCGGLVHSFRRDGFLFDTGPRALGNAGILRPMLDDLEISLDLTKGLVSTGIGQEIVHYDDAQGLIKFIESLIHLFPQASDDIPAIEKVIRKFCHQAEILNRLPNPFFKNPLRDPGYLIRSFLPWLPSFFSVLVKGPFQQKSMEEELNALTQNSALKDMLSQHFFKGTPAPFALGYFENFQDYLYPTGGTGELPLALEKKFLSLGGKIKKNCEITRVQVKEQILQDRNEKEHPYDRLLWAADLNSLYKRLHCQGLSSSKQNRIEKEKHGYNQSEPGESVFTLFIAVDIPPEFFAHRSRGHFIYTPETTGMGTLHRSDLEKLKEDFSSLTKEQLFLWLKYFCQRNSYEISIPVLKNPQLAPPGQSGLIISMLFDGQLSQKIEDVGWIKEFREEFEKNMLEVLEHSIYPGIKDKVLFSTTSTPSTLAKMFNNTAGAITGWSLEGKIPVPNRLGRIMKTPGTAIPQVYKAGQWSYSPSGVPIAILTGRMAAAAMG